jgi:serine/threonine-protein kinase
MAKHPDDRYPSAQEMAEDLRNFQDLEAPAAVQVSQRTLERRSRRRESAKARFGGEAADPPVERFSSPMANAVWRRRKIIAIGVPAALLVVAAAWALAPKRLPKQEQPVLKVAALAPSPAAATNPGEPPLPTAAREAVPSSIPVVAVSNTPPPPARAGRLAFAVSPWGEVYVDGRRRGISPPLQEINLSPGKHLVEIRNTTFQRHSQTVDLDADASVRIKHKFQ